jgi:hypothetical protein
MCACVNRFKKGKKGICVLLWLEKKKTPNKCYVSQSFKTSIRDNDCKYKIILKLIDQTSAVSHVQKRYRSVVTRHNVRPCQINIIMV